MAAVSSVDGLAAGAALLLVRFVVALRLTPFLGGTTAPVGVSVGLGAVLVFLIAPLHPAAIALGEVGVIDLLAGAAREVAIGAGIGAMARIAYSVLETGGALTDIASGSMSGAAQDGPPGPLASLYAAVGTASFLLMGGHLAFVGALAASAKAFPVFGGREAIPDGLVDGAISLFAMAFAAGVMMAAPVFVAGLFARLVVGLVARVSPGMTEAVGAQSAITATTQLAIVAVLGAAVFAGVDFLLAGVEAMASMS